MDNLVINLADFLKANYNSYAFFVEVVFGVFLLLPFVLWCFERYFKIKITSFFLYFIPCVFFIFIKFATLFFIMLNPDEGFHFNVGLSLLQGSNLYVDTDTATTGLVNSFILLIWFKIFGPSIFSMRLLTLIIEIVSFVLIQKSFRFYCDKWIAFALALYFLCYNSLYTMDVISFNCETTFYLFMSLFIFCCANQKKCVYQYFCYITLGLMPFIKLQFVPIAMVLFLIMFIKNNRNLFDNFTKVDSSSFTQILFSRSNVISLILSVFPLALITICFYFAGSLEWFFRLYFYNAFSHISSSFQDYLLNMCALIKYMSKFMEFYPSFLPMIFASFILLVTIFFKKFKKSYWLLIMLYFSIYFSVSRPLQPFNHYLNITMPTSLAVLAYIFSLNYVNNEKIIVVKHVIFRSFVLFWCISIVVFSVSFYSIDIKQTVGALYTSTANNIWLTISNDIRINSNNDDKIVVWGWQNEIYPYSQRTSATSQSDISFAVLDKYPLFNRDKYVYDIKKNKPKFIVDVVSPMSFKFKDKAFHIVNAKFMDEIMKDYYPFKKYKIMDDEIILYARVD